MAKEKPKEAGMLVDCEIIHDGTGVTYFLPPRKCRNCDY
jgi:hypothetical protein